MSNSPMVNLYNSNTNLSMWVRSEDIAQVYDYSITVEALANRLGDIKLNRGESFVVLYDDRGYAATYFVVTNSMDMLLAKINGTKNSD